MENSCARQLLLVKRDIANCLVEYKAASCMDLSDSTQNPVYPVNVWRFPSITWIINIDGALQATPD